VAREVLFDEAARGLNRRKTSATVPFWLAAVALGLLTPTKANAASLSGPITGWASGVPSYVSMYEYVPAKLAQNPPILVVSHYCGGSAAGVFGEAQGGGIVAAADKYGFLMIFPQTSNNCWDVGSSKSLTHDGGGDTQAIAEMVKYAITKHSANANRVYAAGTSSGAMMTEALLAIYPEIFKGGAEFSGVPAGCWAASYSASNQWSGPCAGGQVSKTGQQWGDGVRAMYSGYSGYRPRIQLWHGTADPTINFNNQTEAIKEWINVLGLSTNPSSMTSLTINNHQWTRQSWTDSCGDTVLDAFAEQNGPHGTDANLNATYVIPFLGLDQVGATDPDVAKCGSTGGGGSGGSSSSGGAAGSAPSGGAAGTSGGASGFGGVGNLGGSSSATGGAMNASGATSIGGMPGAGGVNTTGGATSSGGNVSSGGGAATGGTRVGTGAGGSSSMPAAGSANQGDNGGDSGCSCTLAGAARGNRLFGLGALATVLVIFRRRRSVH